jgi:hypothetical protein
VVQLHHDGAGAECQHRRSCVSRGVNDQLLPIRNRPRGEFLISWSWVSYLCVYSFGTTVACRFCWVLQNQCHILSRRRGDAFLELARTSYTIARNTVFTYKVRMLMCRSTRGA